MTRRVRDPRLAGVTRWAVEGDGLFGPGAYYGVNPIDGTVVRIDGNEASERILVATTVAHAGSAAVSVDDTDPALPVSYVWVSCTDGRLVLLDGWTLDVLDVWYSFEMDGGPLTVFADGPQPVLVASRVGGRISRLAFDGTDVTPESDAYLPAPAVALVAQDSRLLLLDADAKLWTYTYDAVPGRFRRDGRTAAPALHGLRDVSWVRGGSEVAAVGYDRQGRGAAVTIEFAGAGDPVIVDVSRLYAPSIVLTAEIDSRVGTVLAQDPNTLTEIPWPGRTDALRGDGDTLFLVARPQYGEVWATGFGGNPDPTPTVLDALLLEDDEYLLLEDGEPLLLET